MHFKGLFISLLAAGVLAIPNPTTSAELDPIAASISKGVVLREDIPEGVEVSEFNEANKKAIEEQLSGTSLDPSTILKRSNCKGSSSCGLGWSRDQCLDALARYSDQVAYCGYVSRFSNRCTAIFTCNNFNKYCMYGWWLKEQFRKIYSEVGCGKCGSYTPPDGVVIGCRALQLLL